MGKMGYLLSGILIACTPLVQGCSRAPITLFLKNNYHFPVDIYNASFIAPAQYKYIGHISPKATLNKVIARVNDGNTYHLIIQMGKGRTVREIVQSSTQVNHNLINHTWRLQVGP